MVWSLGKTRLGYEYLEHVLCSQLNCQHEVRFGLANLRAVRLLNHRIMEKFGLEGTLKITLFQPSIGRDTFH